jgi:hypothetical protein
LTSILLHANKKSLTERRCPGWPNRFDASTKRQSGRAETCAPADDQNSITAAAKSASTAATASAAAATATAASTTTAAVAAAATTTASATTATGTVFAGLGFIDGQCAAIMFLTVELTDGRLGLRVAAHLNESEALAPARFTVADHFCRLHRSVLAEQLFKIRAVYVVAQISDI